MSDSVIKQVLKNLGNIVTETGKEAGKQTEEVFHGIITGKELVGNLKPMTDQEMAQKKAEDERRKQEEMNRLRAQMGQGRSVEQEMTQIRREEEQMEKQREEQMLREIQAKREAERQEYQAAMPTNAKKSAAKHQGAGGKKKKSQPDPAAMSQTSEIKKGVD